MHRFTLMFIVATSAVCDVSFAKEFDISQFGATANDDSDDSAAIEKTLSACGEAGGSPRGHL